MTPLLLGFDARGNPLHLDAEQAAAHMHVVGSSGSGKSKFLESLARQDLLAGRGFTLVDPHGPLYDDLVAFCAHRVLDREIILIDLSKPDTIIPFNFFQPSEQSGGD